MNEPDADELADLFHELDLARTLLKVTETATGFDDHACLEAIARALVVLACIEYDRWAEL